MYFFSFIKKSAMIRDMFVIDQKKKFVYLVFTIIIFLLCYIVHIEIYKSDIYHLNYLKLVDLYMFYIFSKIIVIYSYL